MPPSSFVEYAISVTIQKTTDEEATTGFKARFTDGKLGYLKAAHGLEMLYTNCQDCTQKVRESAVSNSTTVWNDCTMKEINGKWVLFCGARAAD
jgi:hypothetical protein